MEKVGLTLSSYFCMKKILSAFLMIAILSLEISCASYVSGTQQGIDVFSNPNGADVTVDGRFVGKTPLTTQVKRKRRHQIKIMKEGYVEESRVTKKGFNWWFAGNVLIGGIVGIIIDFATGAVYSVEPDEVKVPLVKEESVPTSQTAQKEIKTEG